MFLKRLERRKNGMGHTYWALVESYRTEKGSRDRVVAYLQEEREERLGSTLSQTERTGTSAAFAL